MDSVVCVRLVIAPAAKWLLVVLERLVEDIICICIIQW